MERIKKKTAVICSSGVLAAAVLLVVAVVTLYFAVFRPRPPQVVAAAVDARLGGFGVRPPELNLSLAVEVKLRNPNHAPLRHGGVVTAVAYRGATVGRSAAPPGEVPARSTRTVVGARVQVDAARVVLHGMYTDDVAAGAVPFAAAAAVAGKAEVLVRPFTVTADAEVACSVILYPFRRESSSLCSSTVHVD